MLVARCRALYTKGGPEPRPRVGVVFPHRISTMKDCTTCAVVGSSPGTANTHGGQSQSDRSAIRELETLTLDYHNPTKDELLFPFGIRLQHCWPPCEAGLTDMKV